MEPIYSKNLEYWVFSRLRAFALSSAILKQTTIFVKIFLGLTNQFLPPIKG